MTIRQALPTDRETLLDIWLRSVRASHTFLTEDDIQALLPLVRDAALPALELWVLCTDGGELVGFSGLSGAKMEALFLAPEFVRRGGGRLLVEHARQRKGPLTVDVNEQNPEALRFYAACGFAVVGRSEVDDAGRPFPLLHLAEIGAKREASVGTTIRLASVTDLDAIREIYNYYVTRSTCTFQLEPDTAEERLEWFQSRTAAHPVTVAEVAGEVVGWAALSAWKSRCAYARSVEASVYIHHDRHRRGIGRALLLDLVERARALGHHTVIGGACTEMAGSLALQESLGFERVAHFREVGFKFGRWLDVVYMQLLLAPR